MKYILALALLLVAVTSVYAQAEESNTYLPVLRNDPTVTPTFTATVEPTATLEPTPTQIVIHLKDGKYSGDLGRNGGAEVRIINGGQTATDAIFWYSTSGCGVVYYEFGNERPIQNGAFSFTRLRNPVTIEAQFECTAESDEVLSCTGRKYVYGGSISNPCGRATGILYREGD